MNASEKSVPEAGIEPARPYGQQILSLSCLPIPPLGHWTRCFLVLCFIFCSCMKRKQNPTEGVDYQQLRSAQQSWSRGQEDRFKEIVASQRIGQEIFFAMGSRLFTERGRMNWSLSDLQQGKDYALQCLGQDHHVQILLRNEHGLMTLKAVQALDMENASLVECAKWLTISWSLQLHHRQMRSATRDIELLRALSEWLVTVPQLDSDPWVVYAQVLSLTLESSPDWVLVRTLFERLEGFDRLLPFERLIVETAAVDHTQFCSVDIEAYFPLSEEHISRWTNLQFRCSSGP